jgi:hypothetical protein
MSLVASTTNTGISIRQTVAPTTPSLTAAAVNATKKVAVSDSLQNLKNDLVGLKKNIGNISSINITDTGALSFSGEELTKYADVIAKISGGRAFTATAVDATTLDGVLKNKKVTSVEVRDTAANVGNKIGSLIANSSRVTKLNVSDNATADMAITYSNFSLANASGGLFSKLTAGGGAGVATLTALDGKLNVSGVSVANYASVSGDAKFHSATISDTLANIVIARNTLDTAAGSSDVTKVNLVSKGATSITSSDYTAFKGKTDLLAAIDPNSLKGAFAVTGVTAFTDVAPGSALANDINVKSITVAGSISSLPAITSLSSKVTKVDLSGTRLNFEAAGVMDKLAALGSKLGRVTITDDTTVTVAASNIRRKDVAVALAKTVGSDTKAIGAAVTGANLADVNGLLANKQVSSAAISDTARNMLRFSADKFAMLNNSANVTITIEDNATNVSKYHTELKNAVTQFNSSKIRLSITDTATNLTASVADTAGVTGKNITNIDEVATAISSTYDNYRIKIKQVNATGALDTTSKIKVDLTTYNSSRDILQYVADTTTGLAAKHVELDTTSSIAGAAGSAASINAAKQVSNTLTMNQYITTATAALQAGTTVATAPGAFVAGVGYTSAVTAQTPVSMTGANAIKYNGVGLYEDVAKIDITLKAPLNNAADYAAILGDVDFITESVGGATPTYGLRTGVSISVTA